MKTRVSGFPTIRPKKTSTGTAKRAIWVAEPIEVIRLKSILFL